MTIDLIHSSRPHHSIEPRPTRDPMGNMFGPLVPLETPRRGLLARLFGGMR